MGSASPPSTRALNQDEVERLIKRLIDDDLASRFDVLCQGLPPRLRAHLPTDPTPADHLRLRVHALNVIEPAAGDARPLAVVLRAARAVAGARSAAEYERCLRVLSPHPIARAAEAPAVPTGQNTRGSWVAGALLGLATLGAVGWWLVEQNSEQKKAEQKSEQDGEPTVDAGALPPADTQAAQSPSAPRPPRRCAVGSMPITLPADAELADDATSTTPAVAWRDDGWVIWLPAAEGLMRLVKAGNTFRPRTPTPCRTSGLCQGEGADAVWRTAWATSGQHRLGVRPGATRPPRLPLKGATDSLTVARRGAALAAAWVERLDDTPRIHRWVSGRALSPVQGFDGPAIALHPESGALALAATDGQTLPQVWFWPDPAGLPLATGARGDGVALHLGAQGRPLLAVAGAGGVTVHRADDAGGWRQTAEFEAPGEGYPPHLLALSSGLGLVWSTRHGVEIASLSADGAARTRTRIDAPHHLTTVGAAAHGERIGLVWIEQRGGAVRPWFAEAVCGGTGAEGAGTAPR